MTKWIEGLPAYGRDYKSQAEVKAAWKSGVDFRDAESGRYFSKRDIDNMPGTKVLIRYAKLTKVVGVN